MTREERFIGLMRALAGTPAARALDDDVAVLDWGGEALILTHDMMVEGVHWLPGQDEADIAWKLVATNLSDLAAKGAEPVGVMLGYTLGPDDTSFAAGLSEALTTFNVPLLGGDTVSAGPAGRSLGLTALGRATCRPVPSRKGAQPGDVLWLTGPLGAAMLGFEHLKANGPALQDEPGRPFRRPIPRLSEGQALAPLAHAMMDLSDGLLIDARRMALASGATIAITTEAVPYPDTLPPSRRREALSWGDDYELLCALPAGLTPPCPAHPIGEVLPDTGTPILLDGTEPAGRLGYWHN